MKEAKLLRFAVALVLSWVISQVAFAQVSDRILNVLIGESVRVELVGNVIVTGTLREVDDNSVFMIGHDGEVMELEKGDIVEIRAAEAPGASATDETPQDDPDSDYRRRVFQYKERKSEPIVPFVLNLVPGIGIGSFVQGDVGGGLIALLGEAGGVAIIAVGAGDTGLEWVGLGVLLATRVFALIQPFSYADTFNEQLREELGLSVVDVALVVPGLNGDQDGGFGIEVSMKLGS